MKDLFGEFLEELRRQQDTAAARARGEEPGIRGAGDPGGADRASDAAGDDPSADDDAPGGPRRWDERGDEPPAPRPATPRGRGAGAPPSGPPRHPRFSAGGPRDGAPGAGARARRAGVYIVGAVLFTLFLVGGVGIDLWTDAIWFRSVGFDAVFTTRVGTQVALFAGGLVAAVAILWLNLALAARLSPPPDGTGGTIGRILERMAEASRAADPDFQGRRTGSGSPFGWQGAGGPMGPRNITPQADVGMPDLGSLGGWLLAGLGVLLALGIAGAAANSWETILLFVNRVPFSPDAATVVRDPVFGRDISFFLFDLPFLRFVQSLANGLIVGALLVAGGRYLVGAMRGTFELTTPIRVHLAVLAGLYLVSVAAGYQLDKYELVYSARGVATGVSYTDANAQFLAFDVLTVVAAFAAAFLVGGAFTRMVWPLGMAIGVWLVASLALGTLYPEFVQRFTVVPNQLAQEQPYIKNNIDMTRLAYSLGSWKSTPYGGEAPLTAEAVTNEAATFSSARVWDYRPLRDVIDQVQTVRQYYDFTDVDTDRYTINGDQRQVMLSARELAPEKNPQASSWVNQKLTFTHGVGAVVVPVNEATSAGQPVLMVKDLPPTSVAGAPTIDQFRIYFGERPSDWVVVGARQSEFDYPVGSDPAAESAGQGQQTRWTGKTGIRIDSTLTRLLFAARFRDLNLLISNQVTSESQLLFHRSLSDRLGLIAPFLRFDKDPYLVIRADGSLAWIQDAYTVSDRFPNAQAFDPSGAFPNGTGLGGAPINYIRNSVKIVQNAYDGSLAFYVSDPSDPIIRAYERVFPTLFTSLDQLPADLAPHVRYPEELFNVQARMFATYHVTDPTPFYNREDLWTVPADINNDQTLPNEAYYVEMRMPGEASTEFLLLQPLVPQKRPNMIAWVAVRNDGAAYGEVRVYQFRENTSVLGPNQIEAKIDADPTISAQISLWNQSGSKVIRGNLIVMPIQDSLIYLQPVYLQSTSSAFPELQKVVIATSSNVVWGNTLADALQAQLAAGGATVPSVGPAPQPSASPAPTPSPGASAAPGTTPTPVPGLPSDVAALVAFANRHFELAQAALRNGDFATYGSEIRQVQDALARLASLTGPGASAGASPTASPAP